MAENSRPRRNSYDVGLIAQVAGGGLLHELLQTTFYSKFPSFIFSYWLWPFRTLLRHQNGFSFSDECTTIPLDQ